jgi:hypothetical protein
MDERMLNFHWAMGYVFKDEDHFHIFMRFSPQGRVVKLLDLFDSNEMYKRKNRGKSTK